MKAVTLYLAVILSAIFVPKYSWATINQVEAEIGESLISSRDIYINLAVEQIVFLNKKTIKLPKLNSKLFKEVVASYIVEQLVFKEADLTIDKATLEGPRRANKVLKQLKRDKHWKNLRPSLVELQVVINTKHTSKEVIKKRIEFAKVPISDQEVLVYFEQNKKDFAGLGINKFKENIRSLLSQRDIDKKLADWISFLRTKYSPENIASSRE